MQIGDPIGEGLAIYRRFWRHLVAISFVVAVVVSLLALALAAAGGTFAFLASLLVSIVGTFLITASLTEAVADVRDGRADLTLGETIGRVWPLLGTVVGLSLIAGIAIGVGFVILMLVGIAFQHWLVPTARSENSALFLLLAGLGTTLWATVMMAQLFARAADALDQAPGLPAAKLV